MENYSKKVEIHNFIMFATKSLKSFKILTRCNIILGCEEWNFSRIGLLYDLFTPTLSRQHEENDCRKKGSTSN